ncbi:MAG: hypothetical protein ABIE74_12780 [Pseudomonadota bacterium]
MTRLVSCVEGANIQPRRGPIDQLLNEELKKLEGKNIVDIKFSTALSERFIHYDALIIYEEE